MGYGDMWYSTTGSHNIALGLQTLYHNTTGSGSIAIGDSALFDLTAASDNIAIGHNSLENATTGSYNNAFGARSLNSLTTGSRNNAVGVEALYTVATGSYNNALGYYALHVSTGTSNNAVGDLALYSATTGTGNTGMGDDAGYNIATGSNNSAFGINAGPTTSALDNTACLGAGASTAVSNKVRLGNTAVTVIEGQVAYSYPSDGRFKYNVNDQEVKGLEFIKLLRPVVYNFDTRKFQEFQIAGVPDSMKHKYFDGVDFSASTAVRQSGFIAQEVEQAAIQAGYDFNGIHKPENANDNYSLAYSQFVVPLVKAVKEQQTMIEQLQQQNKELIERLNNVEHKLENK